MGWKKIGKKSLWENTRENTKAGISEYKKGKYRAWKVDIKKGNIIYRDFNKKIDAIKQIKKLKK